jgi:hypothetical protein
MFQQGMICNLPKWIFQSNRYIYLWDMGYGLSWESPASLKGSMIQQGTQLEIQIPLDSSFLLGKK